MSKPLNILHLEDDPDYCALVRSTMEKEGLEARVVLAGTLAEFNTALEQEAFDVILADYALPTGNGIQALDAARQRCPATPFVLVSGVIGEQAAIESLKRGATDYVLKHTPERLVPAVRRAVQEAGERAQRKQAETELIRREEYFRALTENSLDLLTVLNGDGAFQYSSSSLKHVLGYQPEELAGLSAFTLVHPDDVVKARQAFERGLKNLGARSRHEFRCRRRDGGWCHLEVVAQNRLNDPAVAGIVINARDITERKQAEEALRESEEKFRAIANYTADVEAWFGTDGRLLWINPSVERVMGYTAAECLDMPGFPLPVIHAEDRARVAAELGGARQGIGGENQEFRFVRKDGRVRWGSVSWQPIFGQRGQPLGHRASVRDSTDRKEAEETLRKSETHYRSLFQNMLEGFAYCQMLFDGTQPRDFIYLSVNAAFEKLTGLGNVVGRKVSEVLPGLIEAHPELLAAYGRVALTGRPEQLEIYLKPLSRWFSISVYSPERGNFVTIFDNITSRKQAEDHLAEALAYNRTILEASPVAIVTCRASGEIVSANQATVKIVGGRVEQLKTQNFRQLESWRRSGLLEAAETALATGTEQHLEARMVTSFGKEFWFFARLTPFLHGGELHLLALLTDITEWKRAQEQQARLNMAVEQAAECIVITDTEANILYVNPAFERVTGYRRGEAVGQNPRILKSGKQDTAFYRTMWDTLLRGEVWSGHFSNKRKDGQLFEEEVVISPIKDASGKVINYVGVKRDVTHERQVEEQLRQSQKMEAVGQLAGGVAHDFNNLLTVIQGNVELALMDAGRLSAQTKEHLKQVVAAADRAADLIRQLLAFGRKQVMRPQQLDLSELIANLGKMLKRIIGEDVQLEYNYAPKPPFVQADPGMIEQVILNLAVNARDAMPQGGKITITTGRTRFDQAYARRHAEGRAGDFVCLSMSDTGTGIAPEHLPHIFEPFYTTKERGKGTGLGLATAHGIVKQHGGWIEVSSQVDAGTTFKVFLPAIEPPTPATAAEEAGPQPRGGTEKILLVEDERAVRSLTRRLLESFGYHVWEAASGPEALELWRRHAAEIDLLLTDIIMPGGITGWELAEALWTEQPALKAIFMSGYCVESDGRVAEITQRTKSRLLQKPCPAHTLAEEVRRCLDGN
jgi:PAS domain S-box-containing protein